MAASVLGRIDWGMSRDEDGHRTYSISWKIKSAEADGPAQVIFATGLPAVGASWSFGNDYDAWARCYPTTKISPMVTGEKGRFWKLEQTFSTKPLRRCQDDSIEDPLLEPAKVSGSFVKYTKEATKDLNGDMIETSSHEIIRGAQVEFDGNRPTVRIQQNLATLGLGTLAEAVDTVNLYTLWGLAPRCLKLSNISWERLLYGTCTYYYSRTLDFDIDFNTFDRKVRDQGNQVLYGRWGTDDPADHPNDVWVLQDIDGAQPDPDNPTHFTQYKDRDDENAVVILNGAGLPSNAKWVYGAGTPAATGDPGEIDINYYPEVDFLLLGIPSTF